MSPREASPVFPFIDDEKAVFEEPWHAQVLALADEMRVAGHFSATDWANALGAALRDTQVKDMPDTPATYYSAVLAALEKLVTENTNLKAGDLTKRQSDWADAYRRTPHGKPVKLSVEI